jgi:hypothetical protein
MTLLEIFNLFITLLFMSVLSGIILGVAVVTAMTTMGWLLKLSEKRDRDEVYKETCGH